MKNITKLISGFAMLALMLAFFAFKSENVKRATVYFTYQDTTYDDEAYQEPTNWEYSATPPAGCGGSAHTCVIEIDEGLLTGSGTQEEKLAAYLSSLPDAADYVENPSNILSRKN